MLGIVSCGQVAVNVRWPAPCNELDPNLRFGLGVSFDRRIGKRFARRQVIGVIDTLFSTVVDDVMNRLFVPQTARPPCSACRRRRLPRRSQLSQLDPAGTNQDL